MTKPKGYLVRSILHASQVLGCFESSAEVLKLRDVVARTGLSSSMCFRLLYTLRDCGYVEKIGGNQYRVTGVLSRRRRYRIGYASQGQQSSFPREVLASLQDAAEREQIELLVLDNRYQPRIALRNAEHFIREQVDLVIEFQTDESIAPVIASKYLQADIPLIAIDIPHPGATYFGANNYEAGLIGGRALARWAVKAWDGKVDEVLMIQLLRAGPILQSRVRGMLDGIDQVLHLPASCLRRVIDGDGLFQKTLERVRAHLRQTRSARVLIGAANDPSALGTLRAFEEAGRKAACAVMGQNAEPEARYELRRPGTRLIGSVAFFPEKYGDRLIQVALDLLAGKVVPPASFTKHQLITPENVDRFYPNDSLLGLDNP